MDAFLDYVECEASVKLVNETLTSMPSKSFNGTSSTGQLTNLDGGFFVGTGDPSQKAPSSICMASAEKEDTAPFKEAVGSNASGMEGFTFPSCNKLCPPHSEDSAIKGSRGKCMQSDGLLGSGIEFGNQMIASSVCSHSKNLENNENFSDNRFTRKAQVCAICHDKIKIEETAEIKGCEHSYCVTCILRWATYKAEPWCPQCRLPFSFLYVYRALDGSVADYLFEESVCLLLRAFWFKPLVVEEPEEQDDYQDDYDAYEEPYYTSNVRLGNRRWGGSGYVRTGRLEARPVGVRQVGESGSSSLRQAKGKEPAKEAVGRRARRAQKREQLDKMVEKK